MQLKGPFTHNDIGRTTTVRFMSHQIVEYNFFYFFCEAVGTAATPGLLCQPRVIVKMIVEKQMECTLAGETEVSGRKPALAPLLSITKSHMTRPGFEPGPPRWEPCESRLLTA
jgi:hypothetical protein